MASRPTPDLITHDRRAGWGLRGHRRTAVGGRVLPGRRRTPLGDSWLASIFSDDITVRFPAGESEGLTALAELSQQILGMWAATLHQTSNHRVSDAPDGVGFGAALTATHVHWPDEPGAHLRIGARVSGAAAVRARGWRITDLAIDLVWSEGDGPRQMH